MIMEWSRTMGTYPQDFEKIVLLFAPVDKNWQGKVVFEIKDGKLHWESTRDERKASMEEVFTEATNLQFRSTASGKGKTQVIVRETMEELIEEVRNHIL
jgi:hypothetical protein